VNKTTALRILTSKPHKYWSSPKTSGWISSRTNVEKDNGNANHN